MSALMRERLRPGDRLNIAGPSGACFYEGVDRHQPIVLIGAGTGLAPLYGILRDALSRDHRGPVRLYHGARTESGLYLRRELEILAASHNRLDDLPCALTRMRHTAAISPRSRSRMKKTGPIPRFSFAAANVSSTD